MQPLGDSPMISCLQTIGKSLVYVFCGTSGREFNVLFSPDDHDYNQQCLRHDEVKGAPLMDWLVGWLKTVIMVIMLATFVDLLLPSNTMQRYVKTVLSLFILLTLLTPVLQLFQKDWDIDQLLSQAESAQNKKTMMAIGSGNSPSIKSLAEITNDARKMQEADQKKTVELVQRQLAGLMKEDLQKQTKWPVQAVQVQVHLDRKTEACDLQG